MVLSISPTAQLLIVSIKSQRLFYLIDGKLAQEYTVSTSKKPSSCVANSYGTPTGLHTIATMIGSEQPSGMVFKGRVPTQHFTKLTTQQQESNLITSRIIRLRGLERGVNVGDGCDTYNRYIYIHGTNHEARIGRPFSGGCIEMKNVDIIDLFKQISEKNLVWITTN
ncbi:MAG TPA: L,D-transpeptidase [Opitutae bacterium]|nr:L,D-transpeptidase [Coraliomargarita sp.]HBO57491.1 L,D-transpeptidase [Opitutae bacterium]